MKLSFKFLFTVVGPLGLGLACIPSANAACGIPSQLPVHPSAWNSLLPHAHLLLADDNGEEDDANAIVGMWHVTFVAQTMNKAPIPDTPIDNALVVWHSDKTEIMNSMRPPQDGNFCLGVWERTGNRQYLLNHFAWFANLYPNNTNNGIGVPVGPTHFIENVSLSPDGQHYTGTFSLDAYDTAGNLSLSFTGIISGDRVTTNTSMGDLL